MENKILIPRRSNIKLTAADKQEWMDLIADWEKTNESQRSFCARLGLNHHTFSYIRAKFFPTQKIQHKKDLFIPVTVTKPSTSMSTSEHMIIENKNGIKLHVPLNLGEDNLTLLLNLIGWQYA